jgi:hypothetical protein
MVELMAGEKEPRQLEVLFGIGQFGRFYQNDGDER